MFDRLSYLRFLALCVAAGVALGVCCSALYAVPCPNNTCDEVSNVIFYVSGGVTTGVIYMVSPPPSSGANQALILKTDMGLGGSVTPQSYWIYKVEADVREYCDIGTVGTRKGSCNNPAQSGVGVPKSICAAGT